MNRGAMPEGEGDATTTVLSPVPLSSLLPTIYRALDPKLIEFTEALDEVVAPVWLSIDNFSSFVDPDLAPDDFVSMLAAWVGIAVDDNWAEAQKRRLVKHAVDIYRRRGTVAGLRDLVRAYAGVEPEISESGGVAWSREPGGALPGNPVPAVRVRVPIEGLDDDAQRARLLRIVAEAVPAHVAVTVEIGSTTTATRPRRSSSSRSAGAGPKGKQDNTKVGTREESKGKKDDAPADGGEAGD